MMASKETIAELRSVEGTDEADELIRRAREMLYTGRLNVVAASRSQINSLVEATAKLVGFGGIPEDLWQMLTMLDEIMAGKVDRVAALIKQGIPAQLKALEAVHIEQVNRLELARERLMNLLEEGVRLTTTKPQQIVGQLWRARLQVNSSPSTLIKDPAVVPAKYKIRRLTLAFDFPVNAKLEKIAQEIVAKWTSDKAKVAGITNVKAKVEDVIPTKPIADEWKAQDGNLVIPGVEVTLEHHLRIEPAKTKPGDIVQPTPLVLAKPLTAEQEDRL